MTDTITKYVNNSDEYKAKFPVRSDLMWTDNECDENGDRESEYHYFPVTCFIRSDDIENCFVPSQIMRFYDNRDYNPKNLYTLNGRSKYENVYTYAYYVAHDKYLSEHKFAVAVQLYSDELDNATDKMEVIRAEEDYF